MKEKKDKDNFLKFGISKNYYMNSHKNEYPNIFKNNFFGTLYVLIKKIVF